MIICGWSWTKTATSPRKGPLPQDSPRSGPHSLQLPRAGGEGGIRHGADVGRRASNPVPPCAVLNRSDQRPWSGSGPGCWCAVKASRDCARDRRRARSAWSQWFARESPCLFFKPVANLDSCSGAAPGHPALASRALSAVVRHCHSQPRESRLKPELQTAGPARQGMPAGCRRSQGRHWAISPGSARHPRARASQCARGSGQSKRPCPC